MLKSSLCDYSDAYILFSWTITVTALGPAGGNNSIERVFKNYVPFTDCISEINNTQIDNAKDINVIMSVYNLIEYSNNYSKTSERLWQFYRDEPALTIPNFPADDNSASFNLNKK